MRGGLIAKGGLICQIIRYSVEHLFLALKWFTGSSLNISTIYNILSATTDSSALPSIDSNEIGLYAFAIV
jgi:hypothetical protein